MILHDLAISGQINIFNMKFKINLKSKKYLFGTITCK